MVILIPMADGRRLSGQLIASIAMQTEHCEMIPFTRPTNLMDRRAAEIDCRNALRAYAPTDDDVCMMVDDDMVFTSPTDVADARAFLRPRPEIWAGAYNTKAIRPPDHISITCVVYRSDVLRNLLFRNYKGQCSCRSVNADLREHIMYIDDRQLKEVR